MLALTPMPSRTLSSRSKTERRVCSVIRFLVFAIICIRNAALARYSSRKLPSNYKRTFMEVPTMKKTFTTIELFNANVKCDRVLTLLRKIPTDDETFHDLALAFKKVWNAKQSIESRMLIDYEQRKNFSRR